MSDKCSELALECECLSPWYETEEGKQQLLEILNETFWFHADGSVIRKDESCPNCKNELVACVCL